MYSNNSSAQRLDNQSSVSSSKANLTHLSMRDRGCEAPRELFGFIYDIPKSLSLTNADLTKVFKDMHIDCQVQIKRDEKKPFFTARVKFSNSVHLRVATEKMRYFTLPVGDDKTQQCRFLPYDQSLSKHSPSEPHKATTANPELSALVVNYEKLGAKQSENLPDNSLL